MDVSGSAENLDDCHFVLYPFRPVKKSPENSSAFLWAISLTVKPAKSYYA